MTEANWRIKLEVPADSRHLHIVRLTSAGASAEAGLSAAEIDDVKIAVDELCALAIATTSPDDHLSIDFMATDQGLSVEVTVPHGHEPEIDELGRAILEATVDSVEFEPEVLGGGFRVAKSRSDH